MKIGIEAPAMMSDITANLDCTGVILAGGYGTRIGGDKAGVLWRGQPLIAHVAGAVRQVVPQIIAVSRPEQESTGWPVDCVVYDNPELPEGPLRGIAAGLAHCKTPYALVVSCDAPFLEPALLQLLIGESRGGDNAILPSHNGRLQVLCGIYRVDILPRLIRGLQEGFRGPRQVLNLLDVRVVPENRWRKCDPDAHSFINVNTMDALRALDGHAHLRQAS